MIYHFILNPKSGRPRNLRNAEDIIKAACRKRKLSYHIYYTTCPGDATEYVRSMVRISDSRQRFICVGGDGTFSEVVNSAPSNLNVEFGVIPYGSGNDFVKNFSNTKLFADINAQIDGDTVSLDLIKVNDFYCVNMVNIGFDCEVVVKTSKLKKSPFIPSKMAYIAGLVVTLIRKPGVRAKFSINGSEPEHHRYLLNTYANGSFCGGGFHSNPKSSLSDGYIDALFVNNIGRLKFVSLVGDYKKGTHLTEKFAKVLKNKKLRSVSFRFDKETNVCVDGELIRVKELVLSVLPLALNFLIPKGCALRAEVPVT